MNDPSTRTGTKEAQIDDIATLAKAVRNARRRHGLTQAQLAGLSGTGVRFISELERGKPTVSLEKVVDVLVALGLSLRASGPDHG